MDMSKLKVRRGPGRPPKDPEEKVQRLYFYATPWILKAVDYIIEAEKAKGNKISTTAVVRRLLQLGIARYRELGDLPGRDR